MEVGARGCLQTPQEGDDAQCADWQWCSSIHDDFCYPRFGHFLNIVVNFSHFIVLGCVLTTTSVVVSCLGFLYPGNRGFLLSMGVVLYVCFGSPAGYFAARIYKSKSVCLSVSKAVTVYTTLNHVHYYTSSFNTSGLI